MKVSANAVDGFDNDGASGDAVTEVDASYQRACAIEGGEVFCWGDNMNTALGLGSNAASEYNTPQRVADTATPEFRAASAIQLALGFYGGCAVASGTAYCWGLDGVRLGNPAASQGVPLKVVQGSFSTAGSNVTFIGSGANHSCAIESGVLHCWGKGNDYKLGSGSTTDSSAPVQVVSGGGFLNSGNVTAMTGGDKHTCVIEAGKLFCWGGNSDGQVGDGTTTTASAPVAVSVSDVAGFDNDGEVGDAVTNVTSSGSLGAHTCAIEGGVVYCWGNNTDYQLGLGQLYGPAPKKPTKVFVVSAPAAPTISVSAYSPGSLSVGVNKPNDGGSTILSYEYSVDGGTPVSVSFLYSNYQSITISSLTNGTQYSI
jgi:serine/threonine-protein kinase